MSEEASSITSSPTSNTGGISNLIGDFADRSTSTLNGRLQKVHEGLVLSLSCVDTNLSLEAIVARCVDVYMENVFCIHPIVHERSIRAIMNLHALVVQDSVSQLTPESQVDSLRLLRSYALMTALCAATTYLISTPTDFDGSVVGPLLLQVSRDTLSIYHDLDLKQPESSSLVIRMFQAAALHTDGKPEIAWHLFGEALRLADQMRLYDERSFDSLDSLEVRLRRTAFWTLTAYAQYHHIYEEHSLVPYTWDLKRNVTFKLEHESAGAFEEQIFADSPQWRKSLVRLQGMARSAAQRTGIDLRPMAGL
jgi:hypothetical protein